VIGGEVRDAWLGAAWAGSLTRLARNAEEVAGPCATERISGTDVQPIVLDARDVVWPDAGADDAPAWVVITPNRVHAPSGLCPAPAGEGWIVRVYDGAAMLVTGPREGLPLRPEDADRSRAHTVVGMAGWELTRYGWQAGSHAVAAEHADSAWEPAPCTVRGGVAALEAHATAWLAAALAHPAPTDPLPIDYPSPTLGPSCAAAPAVQLLRALDDRDASGLDDLIPRFVDSPAVLTALGLVAWENGRAMTSLDAVDAALDRNPDFAPAALLRGKLLRDVAARLPEARAALDVAERTPDYAASAAYELGVTLEALGDGVAANAAYLRSYEAAPDFAAPAVALGWIAYTRGDPHGARAYFLDAIARDPNHATAYANLGVLVETLDGDYLEAERLYREALRLDPQHLGALYDLALLEMEVLGDLEAAERLLVAAIAADPRDLDARDALDALLQRPHHGTEQLEGLWQSAGRVDERGTEPLRPSGSIATIQPDHVWVIVEDVRGEPTRSEWAWTLTDRRGPQLEFVLEAGPRERRLVVEWIDDHTFDAFDPSDPIMTRVRWRRWDGQDETAAAAPDRYASR
jgi:tetratricopeptide (TPR) repeat protein